MNDKSAHAALVKLNKQRNLIGVGGYCDSRRAKCEGHEKFNTAMREMTEQEDARKLKEAEDGE